MLQYLTFCQNVSCQVHVDGRGGSDFELQVAPSEEAALQRPEQGQQHRPARSIAPIHHHGLALRGQRCFGKEEERKESEQSHFILHRAWKSEDFLPLLLPPEATSPWLTVWGWPQSLRELF